ncbi:MAG: hypothetical protein PF574_03845 [Candidatus Delongbacteria bacterium]|jgi:hypothetical protein|nr:hypothetical protein [Candidatus Delongbacteria bacterium]
MTLIVGLILASCVILLDLKFVSLGLKNIDPIRDPRFIFKYAIPSLFLEIAFIIWVYINLPSGVLFAILVLSVSGLVLQGIKLEGHKFYIYVLIPISEIIIIVFGMVKYILDI